MPNFDAVAMTAGSAPAVHAGLNAQIARWSMAETASGSVAVRLTALPAGAEVIDCTILQSNTIGTGGELLSVYATIGGTVVERFVDSAASSLLVRADNGNSANPMGNRLTASAVAWLNITNVVGTGTAACDFTVVLQYLANLRGD